MLSLLNKRTQQGREKHVHNKLYLAGTERHEKMVQIMKGRGTNNEGEGHK